MPYKDLDKKVTLRTKRLKAETQPLTVEQFKEIRKCAKDNVYFVDTYGMLIDPVKGKIPFRLFDIQKDVLRAYTGHRMNIVLKSRQMGISWLTAAFVLWFSVFFQNKNVLMISIKKNVARRLLEKVKFLYDGLPEWMRPEVVEDSQTVLVFANGSRVESIPTSEDAGRSEGVSLLVIDEAATVRWIKEIWKSAYPTLSTGGMCILLSTPKGMGEFFQKMWSDAVSRKNNFNPVLAPWWKHPIYSIGLIRKRMRTYDGRVVEKWWSPWYEQQVKDLGPREAAQEIDCEFLSSGANFFDLNTLMPRYEYLCKHAKFISKWNDDLRIFKPPEPNGVYVMGIDTATGHGSDYSWAIVRDFVTYEQVATYRTVLPINRFAEKSTELAWFYNGAYVVGEENGVSIASLLGIRDVRNYPEDRMFHDTVVTDQYKTPTERLGWNNNTRSRDVYLRELEKLVRENPKTLKDPRVVSEYLTFIINKNGKPEALEDYNDDAVMADLCCIIGIRNYNPYGALPFEVA